MARGYLGKISAVISANTGDYVRKLNESAKETRAFASAVQNTLGRASKDAAQSLNSIFTPLQKVERALRAAASQKLSFRGFDGAINDVQSLQKALAKLTDQKTIDLVVKTSGVGSLEELKRTINVLRNQDVNVGVEGLRQQRAARQEAGANFVGPVTLKVQQEGERLDAVIEALERIDAESLKKISIQVESQQLDAAALRLRQLVSAGKEIGEPLARAAKQYDGLSLSIQAAFGPALKRAQQNTEALTVAIDSGATIGQKKFAALRQQVELTEAAIKRLAAADSLVKKLGDGRSLRDVAPRQFDALNKAASVGQRSAALSGEAASGFGLGRQEAAVRRQAEILAQNLAARERIQRQGGDTSSIDASIERQTDRLLKQLGVWERLVTAAENYKRSATVPEIRIDVDLSDVENSAKQLQAAFVGRITAIDTAWDQAVRGLTGSTDDIDRRFLALARTIESLDIGDRVDLDPAIAAFRNAVVAGEGYARQLELLSQLEQQVGEKQSFNAMQGNPTGTFGPPQPPRDPGLDLGTDIASPQRALENLRGSIGSVKGQIDSLPAGLRSQFIPAIQGAEAEYRRLFTTVGVTADEIQDSASRLAGVEQGISRASNAARQFGGTFSQFRDSIDARGAAGGLEFLRTALARATGDATRAAAAVDRLAEAYQQAASTPGGFQQNAAELQRLANEAIEATAAVEGVGQSQAGLRRGFARTGDVARGAFGNAGLAIQQAAFALDDFFSVTGGLDQRIRAAGNNISQLGFILGGTAGLIAGIAASIGSQLIVALIKWYNEGRTSEDQVKSLNDALARQKTLVEDLKQAFESLGDSIARRAFSAPAQQAREFAKSLDEITKKQKELREKRLADLDPYVQRERADQARIQRELEAEQDPNRRLALQRDLRRAQRGERAVTEGLIAGAPTTQRDRDRAIAGLERVLTDVNDRKFRSGGVGRPVAMDQAQQLIASIQGGSATNQAAQLRAQQQAIENEARSGRLSQQTADIAAAQLELVINGIEFAAAQATDELAVRISKSSIAASLAIEDAQQDVADAIRRGVEGAGVFRNELDKLGRELTAAKTELTNAQTIENPADREKAVRAAEARVAGVRARQEEVNTRATGVRTGRTFGGERTTAALSALRGSDRFAIEFGRSQAFLGGVIEQEVQARRRLDQAIAAGNDAAVQQATKDLEAAQKASEAAAAFGEAIVAMEGALSRIRKIASSALSQSEQIADNAQSKLTDNPTDINRRARDEAELQLIRDRERVARANNALDVRRAQIAANDPRIKQINADLEAITQERKRLESEAIKPDAAYVDLAEAQRLADREAQLLAERETLLYEETEANRRQIDAINEEIAARRRKIDFENDGGRQTAPAIFDLADSVQNAILQGPSRAALQPTDISTVEGSRELTRLLRGDDAAKTQSSLVELQKQANELLRIIANGDGAAVANN